MKRFRVLLQSLSKTYKQSVNGIFENVSGRNAFAIVTLTEVEDEKPGIGCPGGNSGKSLAQSCRKNNTLACSARTEYLIVSLEANRLFRSLGGLSGGS